MRLRTIAALTILLLAPENTVAFKTLGPRANALTSNNAEKEIGARVNGAAATGFLRPEDIRAAVLEQPNAKAEALLKESEDNTDDQFAFMQFCSLACCSYLLLRVLAWMINILFIKYFFRVLLMLWSIKDVIVIVSRSGRSQFT